MGFLKYNILLVKCVPDFWTLVIVLISQSELPDEKQQAIIISEYTPYLNFVFQEPSNSRLPAALVMLDTSNSGLFSDLEQLDLVSCRDSDTVHVFYVKSGQKTPSDIISNVVSIENTR